MLKAIWAVLTSSRFKSFYWRTGMMALAAVVGTLASNLALFAPYISPATIGVLGLILGEVSKAISNSLDPARA
jgi:hypothetical protein